MLYRRHPEHGLIFEKDQTNQAGTSMACKLLPTRNMQYRSTNSLRRVAFEQEKALSDVDERSDITIRLATDRRGFSWRTVFFGFMRSRRHATRRDGEPEPIFTDWHHPWLFFLAIGIMIMSCLDAFLTLQLIERGAYEANPVMAAVMNQGVASFAISKLALTGFGILALVFLARAMFFNRLRTGLILTCFFSFYAILICYEFVNLMDRL